MRFPLICLLILFLGLAVRAEEVVSRAQRELRARKFYFGEIHGRATDETVSAIRKFQEARGIDQTGNLDHDTLRALSLEGVVPATPESRTLAECSAFVQRYYEAWQENDWKREAVFFADKVNYYFDENVSRDALREIRAGFNQKWPARKFVILQRIASLMANGGVQVTARVRTECSSPIANPGAETEDLIFCLEKSGTDWRIAAVKLLKP